MYAALKNATNPGFDGASSSLGRVLPFTLIGIHIGGLEAKELKEVMKNNEITWRSFVDAGNAGAGPIATKWNLSATPTFYVIDHKGVTRYKWGGAPGEGLVDTALDKLIKAVPSP